MAHIIAAIDYLKGVLNKPALNTKEEIDLSGKIVLITGANSGLGEVAALEMSRRNATVIMACRDRAKAERAMEKIKSDVPKANLVLVELDLSELSSVRKCAAEINAKYDHIDILINNAGVLYNDRVMRKTNHGFEVHMGVNHLGPFLFTMLILDLVKNSPHGRIVNLTSVAHILASLNMDDLMLEKKGYFGYDDLGPYANSKLANMYFTKTLAKKLEGTSVTVYALCPGLVNTDIFRSTYATRNWIQRTWLSFKMKFAYSPEEGVETILYCALSQRCAKESGLMYRFNRPWSDVMENLDPKTEHKLWEESEKLVGLHT